MPKTDRIPEGLLLAAVKRADLHQEMDEPGVPPWKIAEHLSLVSGSWTTRRLHPQLEALEAAGLLEQHRRHGVIVWTLTRKGRRRASPFSALPESPQHRYWRAAGVLAEQEIERFREELIDTVTDAMEGVERESQSDVLLEIAKRLHFEFWRLASVTHCLHEWAEPDDRTPDFAPPEQAGLRNTRKWSD